MPANGLIQGMRPIIGYNYGACEKERMIKTIKTSLAVVAVIMAAGTVISMVYPEYILKMFNAENELLEIGVSALKIISIGFIFSSISVVFSGAFEGMGEGVKSLAITLLRQLIVIIPIAFIMAKIFGINGVWMAFPISEILTMISAIFFMKSNLKSILE